jgi:Trypsin-like peptidase domain
MFGNHRYYKQLILGAVTLFLALSIALLLRQSKTSISCNKVEDSLVYIRGEKNEKETLNVLTGFVIAKEVSEKYNKYFALTASHGLNGEKNVIFTATPFSFKKTFLVKDGYLKGEKVLKSQNENKFRIDTITPVGKLDISVVSFNTNHEIPVACVSSSRAKSNDNSKLQVKGFVMCEGISENNITEFHNRFYYMHTGNGKLLSNEMLKEQLKSSDDFERNFYLKMQEVERSSKDNLADEETYTRHTMPVVKGMSGSPIFDDSQQVVFAIHTNEYLGEKRPGVTLNTNDCSMSPLNQHGYGISMEKILSTGLPDNVRKIMSVLN